MNTSEVSESDLGDTNPVQPRRVIVPPPNQPDTLKASAEPTEENETADEIDATLDRPGLSSSPSQGLTDGHVPTPTELLDATLDRPSAAPFPVPTQVRQPSPTDPGDPQEHAPTLGGAANAPRPKPATTPAPQEAPGYEILGVLGRGGMGVVYKAKQKGLNRVVALKMISGGAHAPPELLARFRTEGEAVAKLRHPNIVQIYDVGFRDGNPYFSLEFLEGDTLQKRIDGVPMPPTAAANMMETLARAMQFAHDNGIIHRDLKPANILFTADGVPKITDFGLAKRLDSEDLHQTATDAVLGTPTYMAPEQAEGRTRDVGPLADLYAMGAILYDLLTGRPPFRGTTLIDTLQMVRFADPVPPRDLQPKVPVDLQTICLKCLEKDPRKRYASCGAFADDLRAFQEGRAVTARPTPAWERAWKWAKRRPAVATAFGVGSLALVGLVIGLAMYADTQHNTAVREAGLRKEAEDARTAEKKARENAEQKEREAVLAKEAEGRERQRAEENLKTAIQTVNDLEAISRKRVLNVPGAESVRKEVLEKVVKSYEEFEAKQPGEKVGRPLEVASAKAYTHLADLRQVMNRPAEAADLYRKALGVYQKLLGSTEISSSATPEQIHLFRDTAGVRINLWAVLEGDASQAYAAESELRQAQTTLTKLAATFPDDDSYRFELALTYNNQGIRLARRQDAVGAGERYLLALKTFDELSSAFQQKPQVQLERARTVANFAVSLGVPILAEQPLMDTAKRLRKVRDEFAAKRSQRSGTPMDPVEADCLKELGAVLKNLGLVQAKTNVEAANRSFAESIRVLDGLAREAPEVWDYVYLLASVYRDRGELRLKSRQFDDARADLTAARTRLEELRIFFASHPEYRLELARVLVDLGDVSRAAGDEPETPIRQWTAAFDLLKDAVKAQPRTPAEQQMLREEKSQLLRAASNKITMQTESAEQAQAAHRWPETDGWLSSLVETWGQLAEAVPTPKRLGDLASTRLALAVFRLEGSNDKIADYRGAAKALDGLPGKTAETWGKYYSAASVLGHCVIRADADDRLTKQDRALLLRDYGNQCLTLLGLAVKNEWRTLPAIDSAPEFRLLRDRPEFRALVRELEERKQRP